MENYLENTRRFASQLDPKALTGSRLAKLGGGKIDRVIVAGMGGSGLTGDLAEHFRDEIGIPVPVVAWKNYGVPKTRAKHPFFIFVSFSGRPAETVSGLKEALRMKPRPLIAVVTAKGSPGELRQIAMRESLPLVTFPGGGLTPREAIGYAWGAVSKLLHAQFPKVREQKPIRGLNLGMEERRARALAKRIRGTVPLVYTDHPFAAVGYVWKICLNETGKSPAFQAVLTELNHNEIAGFETKLARFTALFLDHPGTRPEVREASGRTAKALAHAGVKVVRVPLLGSTFTERTWRGIVLAHFTSYFLALSNKKDPVQTKVIDYLKSLAH